MNTPGADFSGRTALVIGATEGIGRATALAFVAAGANVFAAVLGLTKATALEVARSNIRVNAVAPGPVNTGLLHRMVAGNVDLTVIAQSVPMGRIAEPAEIARAIVWLCPDAASYVTGHVLVADGGLTVG